MQCYALVGANTIQLGHVQMDSKALIHSLTCDIPVNGVP